MFTQQVTYDGILLPNGDILVNYSRANNFETLSTVASRLQGKIVKVEGTLTFNPVAEVLDESAPEE